MWSPISRRRLPPKPRPSQDQRLYAMVKLQGAEAAAAWFEEKETARPGAALG